MNEPWDFKKEDTRKSDSLPNFIIFCEDEVSEPIYLKFFETSLIKVNPVKKQLSKIDNVLKAINYCTQIGLLDTSKGASFVQDENTHVWCVFDRDIEDDITKVSLGNTSFNESIRSALASGLKVAWSNDSFELWVLLHFMDINPNDEDFKNRNQYYSKLTDIFKSIPDPNEDLKKALIHMGFNYKQDCKSDNNFRSIVRSEIVNNTKLALGRAKRLEEYYNNLSCPNHEKSPCTMMHYLVQELLIFGKKEIKSS